MIKGDTYYSSGATIYPGEYEPPQWREKELSDELKKKDAKVTRPPVYISELHDCYRIEMPVPGFRKEDFFIHIDGSLMTIAAIGKHSTPEDEYYRIPSIVECINKEIDLPSDADTDFVTAEYKEGVLYIFFYRTNYTNGNRPRRVIVY